MDSKSVAKDYVFPQFFPEMSQSGRSHHRSIEGFIPIDDPQKSVSDLVSIKRKNRRGSEEFSRAEPPDILKTTIIPNEFLFQNPCVPDSQVEHSFRSFVPVRKQNSWLDQQPSLISREQENNIEDIPATQQRKNHSSTIVTTQVLKA